MCLDHVRNILRVVQGVLLVLGARLGRIALCETCLVGSGNLELLDSLLTIEETVTRVSGCSLVQGKVWTYMEVSSRDRFFVSMTKK